MTIALTKKSVLEEDMKKKIICLLLAVVLCLGSTGCGNFAATEKLSAEEAVNAFLTAYQQGDYEGIKPFIDKENQLHRLFAALGKENTSAINKVYQEVHKRTRDLIFTAAAVEGQELYGSVTVRLKTTYIAAPISESMNAALLEQVKNGGDAFADVPSWLSQGIDHSGSEEDEEFTVYVSSRDGKMVITTGANRDFFDAISGGFYKYLNITMTTCTSTDGFFIQLAAIGDNIVGMVQTETEPYHASEGAEDEAVIQDYIDSFSSINGVVGGAQIIDNDLITRFGVNFGIASSTVLANMGIISGKISNFDRSHLSLKTTISGFQNDGMICETTDFGGSGQLGDKGPPSSLPSEANTSLPSSGAVSSEIPTTDKADTMTFPKKFGSYAVPVDWVESEKYSTDNKFFYVADGTQEEKRPNNISVETGSNRYAKDKHEQFRNAIENQLVAQLKGTGATISGDGSYTAQGYTLYTFVIDFLEEEEVETQYYIVGDRQYVFVYETAFGDTTETDRAAKMIVDSFVWAEK